MFTSGCWIEIGMKIGWVSKLWPGSRQSRTGSQCGWDLAGSNELLKEQLPFLSLKDLGMQRLHQGDHFIQFLRC